MTGDWVLLCRSRTGEPFFVTDEEGNPARFDSEHEADSCANVTPVCMALGYVAVELPPIPRPL